MNVLFYIAIAMVAGLLSTRLVKLIHLPNVTGYLVVGLLLGPSCLKLLPADTLEGMHLISSAALGFIAYSIGSEFKLAHIRALGIKTLIITLFQAVGAVIVVALVLSLFGFDLPLTLVLSAIATATAPAATIMVVRQYKAKGEVTRTLLPVVAMDDAIGLMIFSISISVAQMLTSGQAASAASMVFQPMLEIVLSLVAGGIIGLLVAIAMRFFRSRANRLCISIAAVLLGVALAKMFALSDLLLCMAIGAVLVNLRDDSEALMEGMDRWTPPVFMLFFVISGADLDLAILPSVGLLGLLYIVARSIGKYFGAYFGAAATKASPNIRKYLGWTLLPQAGVAIGMATLATTALPEYGKSIQAVVLCATLIYELVGPVITKIALTKAGEIAPETSGKKKKAEAA